jgi:hypothetical protein
MLVQDKGFSLGFVEPIRHPELGVFDLMAIDGTVSQARHTDPNSNAIWIEVVLAVVVRENEFIAVPWLPTCADDSPFAVDLTGGELIRYAVATTPDGLQ